MKKLGLNQYFVPSIILLSVLIGVALTLFYGFVQIKKSENLGQNALRSLYEFYSLEEFEQNIERFHSYVTDEVFEQMTANNTDRVLGVYLKLKANPCSVNIIEVKSNYIVYSLLSDSIEPERRFLFVFGVKNAKIDYIKEAELFLLPTTRGWEIDDSLMPPSETLIGDAVS